MTPSCFVTPYILLLILVTRYTSYFVTPYTFLRRETEREKAGERERERERSSKRSREYRVAKTHRIPYLCRSFSAKVTYI